MALNEVFPNPTVQQVIFQINFPPIFSMENRIGDYQLRIMERFPASKLIYRRNILIADLGSQARIEEVPEDANPGAVKKIWGFESPEGVTLNVQMNSLDISSVSHKTYNNPASGNRFRDTIQFATAAFLSVVEIPRLTRIGMRYIDNCPVPERNSSSFADYYNTALNLRRFPVENATRMCFEAITRKGSYFLRYVETFEEKESAVRLTLDFDGWAEHVKASDYLAVTDDLHKLISDEYVATIKGPVYEHMRTPKEKPQ